MRSAVILLIFTLAFAGCGKAEEEPAVAGSTVTEQATVTATATVTDEPTAVATSAPAGLTLAQACLEIGDLLPRPGAMIPGPSPKWRGFQRAVAGVVARADSSARPTLASFADLVGSIGNEAMPSLDELTTNMEEFGAAMRALARGCR